MSFPLGEDALRIYEIEEAPVERLARGDSRDPRVVAGVEGVGTYTRAQHALSRGERLALHQATTSSRFAPPSLPSMPTRPAAPALTEAWRLALSLRSG